MAVDWVKCPYCEAERTAGDRTRIQDADPSAGEAAQTASRRTTRINEPTAASPAAPVQRGAARTQRETTIDPSLGEPESAAPYQAAAAQPAGNPGRRPTQVFGADESSEEQLHSRPNRGRRLTGVLVTFTWSPLGELFEVHEGRNYGGSGTISAEGDRDADILVPKDEAMSNAHFLVLCQRDKYRISDCNSTNGTYVNGDPVDALGTELVEGAQIFAGATLFTFKKLMPPTAAATGGAPAADKRPAEPSDREEDEGEGRSTKKRSGRDEDEDEGRSI